MTRPTTKGPLLFFGGPGTGDEPTWLPFEEYLKTEAAFGRYVATVWVHQNKAPTGARALAKFYLNRLRPAWEAFRAAGGEPEKRGLSVEELWLLGQFVLRSPVTCLLNSAQPEQPLGRISRHRKLSAAALWAELRDWYADPALPRLRRWGGWPAGIAPTVVLVYDGEIAHVIRAYTAGEDQLHYADPWPEYSLLCANKNAAGVRARKSDLIDHGWRITAREFQRVIFAAFLYKFPARAQRSIPLTKSERCAALLDEQLRAFGATLRLPAATLLRAFFATQNQMNARLGQSPRFPAVTPSERLRAAARSGKMWMVKVALNEGANVDEKDEFGTPLQAAAAAGHLDIVRLLVKNGADPCAPDASGRTPAQVARQKGHRAVADYLSSLG